MKSITYILMFVFLATIVTAGWFEAQTPPPTVSSSTTDSTMYINLENHLNNTVSYKLNGTAGPIVSNYTIKIRIGRDWIYTGDLI